MGKYVWIALAVVIVGLVFLVIKPGVKQETVQSPTPTTEIQVVQPPTPKQEERLPAEKEQPTQPPQAEKPTALKPMPSAEEIELALKELGYTDVPEFWEEVKKVLIEKLPRLALARVQLGSFFERVCLDRGIMDNVTVRFSRKRGGLPSFLGPETKAIIHLVPDRDYLLSPKQCFIPNPSVIYLEPGDYVVSVRIGEWWGEGREGGIWEGQLLPKTNYIFTLGPREDLPSVVLEWNTIPVVKLLSMHPAEPEEVRYLLPSAESLSNLEHYVKIAVVEASKSPKLATNSLTMIIREPVEQIVQEIFIIVKDFPVFDLKGWTELKAKGWTDSQILALQQTLRELSKPSLRYRQEEIVQNITTKIEQMILIYVHECRRGVWPSLSLCLFWMSTERKP